MKLTLAVDGSIDSTHSLRKSRLRLISSCMYIYTHLYMCMYVRVCACMYLYMCIDGLITHDCFPSKKNQYQGYIVHGPD